MTRVNQKDKSSAVSPRRVSFYPQTGILLACKQCPQFVRDTMTLLADPICITVWTTKCTWSTYWLLYYVEGRRRQRPVGAVKQSDSLDLSSLTFQSYASSSRGGICGRIPATGAGLLETAAWVAHLQSQTTSICTTCPFHSLYFIMHGFGLIKCYEARAQDSDGCQVESNALLVNLGCPHLTFSWWRWLHMFWTCSLNTNTRVRGRCPVMQNPGWCLWKPHGQNPYFPSVVTRCSCQWRQLAASSTFDVPVRAVLKFRGALTNYRSGGVRDWCR